jgi:two-component system sensor histidine kinase SenX3
MRSRVRLPIGVTAAALFGLLVVLAMLQYRWLGQISDADRDQRRTRLTHDAYEFAQDFDRELARAYLLFQGDPMGGGVGDDVATRVAQHYDHWQSTSAFPRLLKDIYAFTQTDDGKAELRRFDPASRRFDVVEWPPSMSDWREQVGSNTQQQHEPGRGAIFVRRMAPVIWERVPALVVPSPMFFFAAAVKPGQGATALADLARSVTAGVVPPSIGYSILVIDKEYVTRELLPALARRHFAPREADSADPGAADPPSPSGSGGTSLPLDFKIAIVARAAPNGAPVFQSTPSFAPAYDAKGDAVADLFQVRTQDFTALIQEIRKFTATVTQHHIGAVGSRGVISTEAGRPLSFVFQQSNDPGPVSRGGNTKSTMRLTATGSAPLWRVIAVHPSGSLEQSVNAARTRNLIVSFSILAILGASMGLLVLTTRRAQRLAQQQMEFVATVSHELRTPLAVIRSAAENLADGVIGDEERIRRYGELMRSEGRRLTEMVEQILEIAGMQSGQRNFALRPVAVEPLVRDILSSCASLIERAGITVELDVADGLPAVLGDETALRRVFQNLIDNAIKYGAAGGWVRIAARAADGSVAVSVADRGIGIDPAEHSKIFEPFYRAADVVAAQMQGAGLGLSLVRRIVIAHGGSVTVTSVPRGGSEFVVRLPAAKGDPIPAAGDVNSAAAAPRYS